MRKNSEVTQIMTAELELNTSCLQIWVPDHYVSLPLIVIFMHNSHIPNTYCNARLCIGIRKTHLLNWIELNWMTPEMMGCYKNLTALVYSAVSHPVEIFKKLTQKFKDHLKYLQHYSSISLNSPANLLP